MDHTAVGTGIGNEAAVIELDDEDCIFSRIACECLCVPVTSQERIYGH